MSQLQYENTLLEIYSLCEVYTIYEGTQIEKLLQYLKKQEIKMDTMDFFYYLVEEFIKKVKDDIRTSELKKTYLSGSIVPPPNENLVITQEYLKDIGEYVGLLQTNTALNRERKIQLSYSLELSSLIAFHYQLKWALQTLKSIRTNKMLFSFLMSDINNEED